MIIGLVGISGVGKTYLKNEILNENDSFISLVAVTTREPRKNEIDGVDKFFLSKNDFDGQKNAIDIISEMYGAKYGFWKRDLSRDEIQVVELYFRDVRKLKKYKVKTILITSGNIIKTFKILYERYGMSNKLIKRMFADFLISVYFATHKKIFDYVLKNDYSEKTYDNLKIIIKKVITEG